MAVLRHMPQMITNRVYVIVLLLILANGNLRHGKRMYMCVDVSAGKQVKRRLSHKTIYNT